MLATPLMLARTEPACLVIADIAGYSSYLAGVELDHECGAQRADDGVDQVGKDVLGAMRRDGAVLVELAEADARERAAGRPAEPVVPDSRARHLTAPVTTTGAPIAYLRDQAGPPA